MFNCGATYQGLSLNSQLLQGPDLINSLTGVLTMFRQGAVAFIADVEAMFLTRTVVAWWGIVQWSWGLQDGGSHLWSHIISELWNFCFTPLCERRHCQLWPRSHKDCTHKLLCGQLPKFYKLSKRPFYSSKISSGCALLVGLSWINGSLTAGHYFSSFQNKSEHKR